MTAVTPGYIGFKTRNGEKESTQNNIEIICVARSEEGQAAIRSQKQKKEFGLINVNQMENQNEQKKPNLMSL